MNRHKNNVELPTSSAFHDVIVNNVPLIDVRAPVEFLKGALPNAVNLPFINNEERRLIGICYKEKGQQAAIALGHKLVNGETKFNRIHAWQQFIEQYPNALIYCARGGLRSMLSQQWLLESGVNCKRVQGGFKSLRTFLLRYLAASCDTSKFVILSGMTGTGKTDIINSLDSSLDLEGYANHKGSSFGRPLNEQPTQIDFENRLISALLKARTKHLNKFIVIEDENRSIGGVHLPHILNSAMAASSIVVIELPHEERIHKLWQEYVLDRFSNTMAFHKAKQDINYEEQAQQAFSSYLTQSLFRIQRRLGGQRTKEILALMNAAISRQHIDNFTSHKDWLRVITQDYYDPMYLYQLNKRKESVVFTGNHNSVVQYLRGLA